ncbi:MAG: hypothetical protein WCY86_06190 [Spirosomataceae bacterium]
MNGKLIKKGKQYGFTLILFLMGFGSWNAFGFQGSENPRKPLKVKGEWPEYALQVSEVVITFEDTVGVTHHISRLLRADGSPEGYVSHIETPVCTDTLCALMDIRMYWTLAGTYWAYDTIPTKPLTKNDHIEFDEKDYEKLHELLQDEQSILRRRHKDDLFEKEEKRVSQVVDAVTGATSKEVKEAVVEGAVYSSYTIYHLVHSQLAAVIREDLKNNLLTSLGDRLLYSNKIDERIFFIKELPPDELRSRIDPIIETIPEAVPRDRLYILKKMPSDLWNLDHVQVAIAEKSSNLDIHSLSYFLNQLKGAKSINPESLRYLSQIITTYSVNQLRSYLSMLEKTPGILSDAQILAAIQQAASDPDYPFSAYLKSFLNKQGIDLKQ